MLPKTWTMLGKRISLLISLLIFGIKAYATTFVVTNNADSGPGTLRDALTQAAANGSATTDYINFNLPDQSLAGRTIVLLRQLPAVSSNLVIDGTTQPGNRFGVSDAKVKIMTTFVYPANLNILYSNTSDRVEIYGLWLWGGVANWGGLALHFRNFGTLRIGAPSKGNIIERGNIGIDTGKACFFQNNICWTDTTGEIPSGGNISVLGCDSLTFGGSKTTGNVAAGIINLFFSNPVHNYLLLSNNKFGTDISGTKAPYGFNLIDETRVSVEGPYGSNGQPLYVPLYATISNNIIADVYEYDLLYVRGLGGKIVIQGNAFNTDFTGTLNFNEFSQSIAAYAIACGGNKDVVIGGDLPSEKNLIAYCEDGIGYSNDAKYTITKNSIFCVGENSFIGFTGQDKLPQVKINSVSSSNISGTATPNSAVELFSADCNCYIPNPKGYFSTVKADANGNWQYNGSSNGFIMASATLDSLTGYFVQGTLDDSKVLVANYTCNSKGSITGIASPYSSGYKWYNDQNQLVGTDLDLKDMPPGNYTLKIDFGTACNFSKTYTIKDYSLKVDVSSVSLNSPICGKGGSVTGIKIISASDQYNYQWSDQNGKIICNCIDLTDVGPGSYSFAVTNSDGTCRQNFGPYRLSNAAGLNVDQSHVDIVAVTCGQAAGSVTALTVTGTGTIKYTWTNSAGQVVAQTKDLTGQPYGKYTLQITDDSQCDPVILPFEIPEIHDLTISETKALKVNNATCGEANGSITGLFVSGGDTYTWINGSGKVVGHTVELLNVGGGDYQLALSNSCGDTLKGQVYHIDQQDKTTYPKYQASTTGVCSNNTNGAISVNTDALVKSLRWVNSQGVTVGNSATLTDVPPGSYQLYLTDQNGCETLYSSYTVAEITALQLSAAEEVNNDQCSMGVGSIKNIGVNGGETPYTYTWTDSNGNTIASTADISGLKAGEYTLTIKDASNCNIITNTYTIQDQQTIISLPSVSNVQLCSPGDAMLTVKDPSAGYTYRLYGSEDNSTPIDIESSGRFKVNVASNTVYYISQVSGACESDRAQVQVTVGIPSLSIANTITPNGDGVNDYWNISGIENYPAARVQVFTRYGQKVFDSKGYQHPFDGTYGGKTLPTGVYYYIIDMGNPNCNLLSGSLTILR
ncbi:MAG: gliding motility-associated C-terminal domain-containing protein [Bacteroidetes bacterium]|nr:gliding motility-associated C-terminal domain-containing protein [Bacteroidota bacterium]